MEGLYWENLPPEDVDQEIGASTETVDRRRDAVLLAALEELKAAGVATYAGGEGHDDGGRKAGS